MTYQHDDQADNKVAADGPSWYCLYSIAWRMIFDCAEASAATRSARGVTSELLGFHRSRRLQVVTLVSHSPGNLHKSGGCNLEIPVASPPFVQVASPPFVQAVQPN